MTPGFKISFVGENFEVNNRVVKNSLIENLPLILKGKYRFFYYRDKTGGTHQQIPDSIRQIFVPGSRRTVWGKMVFAFFAILRALWNSNLIVLNDPANSIFLPFFRIFSGTRVVFLIDSLAWREASFSENRKIVNKIAERISVKYSDVIISTSHQVREYLKREYGVNSFLIPYGSNTTPEKPQDVNKHLIDEAISSRRYIFCYTKILPESRAETLIRVFAQYPRYDLVMVADWEANEYAQEIYSRYNRYENIHLLDQDKSNIAIHGLITNAYIYIHNCFVNNGVALLYEAMKTGVPVIAFDKEFNREITDNEALYFSHHSDLLYLLETVRPSRFTGIGEKMMKIALQQYSWSEVAQSYDQLFTGLLTAPRAKYPEILDENLEPAGVVLPAPKSDLPSK